MGGMCSKSKVKQPTRASPTEMEEKKRQEEEARAAAAREAEERERAAAQAAEAEAKAREEEERARAEAEEQAAAAAAAAAAAEAEARRQEEEEARRLKEEEERKAAEAQAARDAALVQEPEEPAPTQEVVAAELEPGYASKEKLALADDAASEATMETSRPVQKVPETQYGAPHAGRKARTITPCDMTAVDEASLHVSKRCGCDLGPEHDENNCLICQSIDLSDTPLLN